ncbi:MAG: hypothetical protein VB142_03935 [Burkholderia sp.]
MSKQPDPVHGSMMSCHSNASFSMNRYAPIVSDHPWLALAILSVGFSENLISSRFALALRHLSPRSILANSLFV